MKILFINEYYSNFGGAEKYIYDISLALEEKGHEIVIIASEKDEHVQHSCRKIYFVPESWGIKSSFRVKKLVISIIRDETPDIVHIHNSYGFISPIIVREIMKLRSVIVTFHDVRVICPSSFSKILPASGMLCKFSMGAKCFLENCYPFCFDNRSHLYNIHKFLLNLYNRSVLKKAERVVLHSRYMLDEFTRNGFIKNKISLFNLFASINSSMNLECWKDDQKIVLYVGRLDRTKGLANLFKSMLHVKTKDWRAIIIGDGDEKRALEMFLEDNGLLNRVKFLGKKSYEDVCQYYMNCRMVVMPSIIPESFGLVGIEAMSFAKPVVAFGLGGCQEWIKDCENGFLVQKGDVKSLANRISELLDDRSLAMNMGLNGREMVKNSFTMELHLQNLMNVYNEVIECRDNV